jgi:hypothetical protein
VFVPVSLWKCLSDVRPGSTYFYHNLPWDLQLEEKIPRGQECALETRYMDVNDGYLRLGMGKA